MRLTVFLFFMALLNVSAATLAQQVTLHEKQASMEKVLNEIQKQTGYNVFYGAQVLKDVPAVDVDLKDVPLEQALNACFKDAPLTFKIIQQTIVVKRKEETPVEKASAPLPPSDIIGRITNDHGQPLDGASVIVKRTQTGTLTHANGDFTLRDVYPTDTLILGFVGYGRTYIPVGNQKVLKIILNESSNQLDQVVIQAYGNTSQRLATGDIGTVTAKQIEKQPVMNVLEALQGQVAGAVVTNTGGYASGNIKVEIRGRNSIGNFTSDPLYIIDGVPLTVLDVSNGTSSNYQNGSAGVNQANAGYAGNESSLFGLNPADVESISVLKDADATAIYGSRGANGVILITTKKGKVGKTRTSASLTQGLSEITQRYALLNTQQYIAMREEALRNDGLPVNIQNSPDLVLGDPNRYTNWQQFLWGSKGKYTDAELSMSGGDSQNTFRLAGGYHYQRDQTAASGSNFRGSLSMDLDHKSLDQRFELGLNATYSYTSIDEIGLPGLPNIPPDAPPVYDKNGNLNFQAWDNFFASLGSNPFGQLLSPFTSSNTFLNAALNINYKIVKGLDIKTTLGYNNNINNATGLNPIASQDPIFGNLYGTNVLGTTQFHNLIFEPHFEYNSVIGKGKLATLIGASAQASVTDATAVTGSNYTNDALLYSLDAAPTKYYNASQAEYKYAGFFGRINYNWEDKYIINLNVRRDGSSRFGPGRQYGNFGSVGAAYIFSEEKWFKNNAGFLSLGKLRGSYGTTGNDQIGDYQYLTQWIFGQYPYNRTLPITPIKHTDSLFHWEVNKKLEFGLQLAFLKDRIILDASWFRNRCNDQLVAFPTPAFTGFQTVLTNTPADVQNTGEEFVFSAKVIDNADFKWSVHFNTGFHQNKLLAYPNLAQSPYASILVIGQSLNIVHLLHNTGVDPLTGLYTFEDKNHDGQITWNNSSATGHLTDDTYTYDLSPKFDGSFSNTFNYKNWELSLLFYIRKQLGYKPIRNLDVPGDESNQPLTIMQNVWQKPGDIAQYARLTTDASDASYFNFYNNSDGVLTDASFIRLQNLSLTYTLPDKFLKGISGGSVFLRGQNLFVITRYKGPDPEIQSYNALPLPTTLTLGFSLNL